MHSEIVSWSSWSQTSRFSGLLNTTDTPTHFQIYFLQKWCCSVKINFTEPSKFRRMGGPSPGEPDEQPSTFPNSQAADYHCIILNFDFFSRLFSQECLTMGELSNFAHWNWQIFFYSCRKLSYLSQLWNHSFQRKLNLTCRWWRGSTLNHKTTQALHWRLSIVGFVV